MPGSEKTAEKTAEKTPRRLEADLAARVDGEVRFDAGPAAPTPPTARTSGRSRSAWCCPVPWTPPPKPSKCAASTTSRCCPGAAALAWPQCTNTAVVIDWSKYCNRLLEVDPANRTCTVEPGIVLDVLNDQLKEHGLRFGPEPATHMNCTIGGMIGNNSCGATAQRTGKVVDNIAALEVLLYDGTRFWCGPTTDDQYQTIERRGDQRARIYRRLRELRDTCAEQITETIPRHPTPRLRLQPGLAAARARLRHRRAARRQRVHPGHRAACEAEAGAGPDPPVAGGPRLSRRRESGRRGAAHP